MIKKAAFGILGAGAILAQEQLKLNLEFSKQFKKTLENARKQISIMTGVKEQNVTLITQGEGGIDKFLTENKKNLKKQTYRIIQFTSDIKKQDYRVQHLIAFVVLGTGMSIYPPLFILPAISYTLFYEYYMTSKMLQFRFGMQRLPYAQNFQSFLYLMNYSCGFLAVLALCGKGMSKLINMAKMSQNKAIIVPPKQQK